VPAKVPLHDVERVRAAHRVRASRRDDAADPVRAVRGRVRDLRAALLAGEVEERPPRRVVQPYFDPAATDPQRQDREGPQQGMHPETPAGQEPSRLPRCGVREHGSHASR